MGRQGAVVILTSAAPSRVIFSRICGRDRQRQPLKTKTLRWCSRS